MSKEVGRNDPCTCGSGKKYKKCCALKLNNQKRVYTPINSMNSSADISRVAKILSESLDKTQPKGTKKTTDIDSNSH